MARDLSKELLYESVKKLVEMDDTRHLHLNQHKLFTLFSIAFQYLLFRSTKKPGSYIIRIENSPLADKLAKKSKDSSTRRFIQSLLLPRKLKFNKSTFYLDFFHVGSWNLTNDIPSEKIKGALIVKNTTTKPMDDLIVDAEDEEGSNPMADLPADYYLTSLLEVSPKTLTIAYEEEIEGLTPIEFEFIQKEGKDKTVPGVKIAKDIDVDNLD